MDSLNYFLKLYREKKQLTLLALAYCIIAGIFVFVAGICALFNQSFGISMLIIPLSALAALCFNIVVWALVKLILDSAESREADKKSTQTKKSK